ncbi:MAG: ABC transporter ATP-binding protein [Comamonadaceae bacterium]|nr:ABC transporter ATP-binding protein [Comamonadaceae bacterium]
MTAAAQPAALGFARLLRLAPVRLGLAVAAAVASSALSMAPLWLMAQALALLLAPAPGMDRVYALALGALGLLALRWVLTAASHALAHAGALHIGCQLRLRMVHRLGQAPLSFFSGPDGHSGRLRRTLTDDVSAVEGFFAHTLPDAVAAACVPVAALALLFASDWRLALAAALPLPLAVLAQMGFMRGNSQRMAAWQAMQQDIARHVGEYVRGIHVVKSFGLDARAFGRLASAVQSAAGWVARHAAQSASGWVLFTGVLGSGLALVAPLGAWLYHQGRLPAGTYVLFLLLAPAVPAPLLRLTFLLGEQAQRAGALARIGELLDAPVLGQARPDDASACHAAAAPVPEGALALGFAGVSHRHGQRLTLHDVHFTARAGQVTALVGASGSGKSTLIRLAARLYEPASGQVLLGGRDVRAWPQEALLARIALVSQDVFLLHGTVRDNLRLARPQASDAQIERAARAAHAHGFIAALPQGYDTPLGERGARLSGGERQRLSIARALLKDAPLLLLDEATAHLDAESEQRIQQTLQTLRQGRTVLMVAHRLHAAAQADHIVVMHEGRAVSQGTHAALLHGCPVYQRLWRDHARAQAWTLAARDASRAAREAAA